MVSFWFNSNFKVTISKNEDDLYFIFNKYPNRIQFDPRETESVSPEIARTWTTERFKSTLLESISQLFPLLVFYAKFYIMQDIVAESNAITHLICIFYVEVGPKLLCIKIVQCTSFHIFPQNQIFINFLFQLWEDAQLENIHLRDDLNKVRDELKSTKKKLDNAIAVRFPSNHFGKKAFLKLLFLFAFWSWEKFWCIWMF